MTERSAPRTVAAVLGTLVLLAYAGVAGLFGLFSGMITDACSADSRDAHCRNAGWIVLIWMAGPIVVGVASLLATWRRSRGRPRPIWLLVGVVALAALLQFADHLDGDFSDLSVFWPLNW